MTGLKTETVILDSTLREGELFRVLKPQTKVAVAERLAEAGLRRVELTVDYPPRTTREDVEPVVKALNDRGCKAILHCRAVKSDVEAAAKYDAEGIAVYISPTKLHREHKLRGITYEEAVERLVEAVEAASAAGFRYIRATVEDASRFYVDGELEKLVEAVRKLAEHGATLVSVPDTAGLLSPALARQYIKKIKQLTQKPLAAHFHNDYGMASANTVEAVLESVEEAHVTIMGVGDRNGIADLYEVVAVLEDVHGVSLGVDRRRLRELYGFFSKVAGLRLPWRHPLSDEAQTIRAGVHQAMAVSRPDGYMPRKKLETDFGTPIFHAGVYISHRLVATLTGLESDDPRVRRATEMLATRARERSNGLSLSEIRKVLAEEAGLDLDMSKAAGLLKPEKVFMLVKLNPRFSAEKITSTLAAWEDVESVDEVYGDADLVVTGKISLTGENFVERFKQSFGEAIEYLRILVTD